MKMFFYAVSFLISACLSLYAQSGTFDFGTGASQSGDPTTVTQTKSGVVLTVSATSTLNDDIELYDMAGEDGTSGSTAVNMWGDGTTMVLTFSATVNISTLRIGEYQNFSYSLRFTPNTGSYVDVAIDGTNGTTATVNFIGITSITITKVGGGTISLILDNVVMDGALPVELTSFTALIKNSIAELNWKTATEVDNFGFEIQRAAVSSQRSAVSGQLSDWETIGFVNGHGNSNSPKDYSFIDDKVFSAEKYFYRLKQIDTDGSFEYSDVVEVDFGLPNKFELMQNYPNPFNPTTIISYTVPQDSRVRLTLFNSLGQEIAVLEDGFKVAGFYNYQLSIDNYQLNNGVYFYELNSDDARIIKKLILLK